MNSSVDRAAFDEHHPRTNLHDMNSDGEERGKGHVLFENSGKLEACTLKLKPTPATVTPMRTTKKNIPRRTQWICFAISLGR